MSRLIELTATGESIEITKSSADTGGAYLEGIVRIKANGEGPPKHRHPLQTEEFTVLEGKLIVECNSDKHELSAGQSFTVPANAAHRFYSADGKEVSFRAIVKPALHLEYFIAEIFEASNRNNSKAPGPFDAAYILGQMKGEYYLTDVPVFIQKTIFPVMAFVGRITGLVKARKRN
jgi:quercetin dioxygenase-like cupin family protein